MRAISIRCKTALRAFDGETWLAMLFAVAMMILLATLLWACLPVSAIVIPAFALIGFVVALQQSIVAHFD